MMGRCPKLRSSATIHSVSSAKDGWAKDMPAELRPLVARLSKVTIPSGTNRVSDASTLQLFTMCVVGLVTVSQIGIGH